MKFYFNLYHERFEHQNKPYMNNMIKQELGINFYLSDLRESCIYGKTHCIQFGTRKSASITGDCTHTDICRLFVESMSGFWYFVLLKDDYTQFCSVYFIKKKSEIADKLVLMLAEANTIDHVVEEMLSDNGEDFDNYNVSSFLQHNGIIQCFTMPYTLQQNGRSEWENRTIEETARAIMHSHENSSRLK